MRRSAGTFVRERRQRVLRGLTTAFVAAGTVIAPGVNATISATAGQITKVVPPACDDRSCGEASNTTMYAWDEQQGVTLASNLSVDITQQGDYTQSVSGSSTIPAGTVVDSHFINSVRVTGSGTIALTGTVSFPTDILGIIITHSRLVNSNVLGPTGTTYGTASLSDGVELNNGDELNFSSPRTVTLTSSEANNFDRVRILTKHDSPPLADAGGPYTGAEGGTVTLHGTATDPNDDPIVTSWSFDTTASRAGTVCTPGATTTLAPTISCNDDAVVTATLTVSDPFHDPVTSSAQVTIGNATPVLGTISAPTGQIPLANTVTVSAPFTDAGTNDTHTATVDWGDTTSSNATITESNGSGSLTASHDYATGGLYTATITLHDDDSGLTTGAVVLHVNGPPVAEAGGPYSTTEGTAAQLTGTANDPEHDPLTTGWSITPTAQDPGTTCNSTGTATLTPTVTCDDDAVLGATLTADDGVNPPVTSQTTVTVLNAAPVLGTPSITNGPVPDGANVHVAAGFTDAGTHDTHTASINWGDMATSNGVVTESNGSGSVSGDHSYSQAGLYTVTITLTDDNGGTSVQTTQVLVNTPPTVSAGGPYAGSEGSQLLLQASANDVDGDTLTYSWTYTVSGANSPHCTPTGAGTHLAALTLVCDDDAVVHATVTVSDGVNAPVHDDTTLAVGNVAPVVGSIVQDQAPPAGSTVGTTVGFSDAGANDTHTATIDWGDNSSSAGVVNESNGSGTVTGGHSYATDGYYTVTVTVTDDDGGSTASSGSVLSDTTPPVITSDIQPPPNGAGWNNTPVTVTWNAVDPLTTIANSNGCDPVTRSTDTPAAGVSFTCSATSQGGTSTASTTVKLDQVPPALTGSATTAPNANGWYKAPVTVHWSCSDALSGVAGPCPPDDVVASEGSAVTASASASDVAGNTTDATSAPLKIDTTAPSTSASTLPEWNNSTVTLQLSATDGLSGVDTTYYAVDGGSTETGTSVLLVDDGVHHVSYWSVDEAGNVEAANTATVKIDSSAPSIAVSQSPQANAAGWNNSNVTVTFTCGDSGSGVSSCTPQHVVSSEGAGQDVSGTAVDNAGNSASASTTLNIDKTPPVITGSTPPANAAGWHNAPVTVMFACTDALSGVATCADPATLSGDGAGQSVSGSAADAAGNGASATVGDINIDQTPPTITASADTPPNAAGWNNGPVTLHFTCDDVTSGVAFDACPSDVTVSSDGVSTVARTVTDRAGNTATASVVVRIDTTTPTIVAHQTPDPNGAGWNNTDVTVSFDCTDTGSGIATAGCTAPVAVPEGANQSVTGTATDLAGNVATVAVSNINVDETPPQLSGTPTTPANGHGWYDAPVTVHWACSDALSGITGPCPPDSLITGENTGLTASAAVTDIAGNNTSATSAAVNIDTTAPVTTQSSVPDWANASVTFTLHATDALSGVDVTHYTIDGGPTQSGGTVTVSGDGTHQVDYWSVDNAGNVETANTATVKIDTQAPTITVSQSPHANAAGWNNTDVTVTFTCTDPDSGVASCSSPQTVTGEGAAQAVAGNAVDNAGNSSATSTTLNIDKTPPSIDGVLPPQSAPGWYNTPVTVTFACNDALSGVATCADPATLSGDGAGQSVSGTATDTAGNSSATTVSGINLDQTPPTLTASAPPAPLGWYNGPVTVHWTCSDDLSGVTSCPGDQVVGAEGFTTLAQTITDQAGNSTTTDITIRIDETAPSIVGTATPAPNGNGWNDTDVTVSFACADNGSGVASCSSPATLGEGTGQSVTGHAADVAGNSASAAVTGVNVDKTPPTLSASPTTAPNAAGWYDSAVTLHWTCADSRSGVDPPTCPANSVISTEGAAQQQSGTVLDLAGNATTASSPPVKIDLTAPVTTASNVSSSFTNTDVTVDLTANDNLSGVARTVYSVDGGPDTVGTNVTFTSDGLHTLQYASTDVAGNVEATHSVEVRIDKTGPTITAVLSPTPNAAGWNNSNVTVTFTCSDSLSGIATCSAPQTVTTDGAAQHVSGSATDNAGNTSVTSTVVSLDKTPPTITGSLSATANANGWFRVPVAVSFTCTDALSGLASCSSPTTLGEGANQTVTGHAGDVAGNTSTASVGPVNVDLTPPSITASPDRSPDTGGMYSGPVTIHFTCADALSGIATGTCPADVTVSGNGTTTVSGSVTDRAGNVASASAVITITINSVPSQKQALLVQMSNALPASTRHDTVLLRLARNALSASINPPHWFNGNHCQVHTGIRVFEYERLSVTLLSAMIADRFTHIPDATLRGWIAAQVGADRQLAVAELNDAVAAVGHTQLTNAAGQDIAAGDAAQSNGQSIQAVTDYLNAWRDSYEALGRHPDGGFDHGDD